MASREEWPAGPAPDIRDALATLVTEASENHGCPPPKLTWGRRRRDRRWPAAPGDGPLDLHPLRSGLEPITVPALFSTGFYRPADARVHLSPGSSTAESLLVALHEVAHHLGADALRGPRRRGTRRTVHGEDFWRTALDLYEAASTDRDLMLLRQVLSSPVARHVWRERHGRLSEPFTTRPDGHRDDDGMAVVLDRHGELLGRIWTRELAAPPGMRWRSGAATARVWYGHAAALSTMPYGAHRTARAAARAIALEALAYGLESATRTGSGDGTVPA